jgi:hypothetical protein
MTDDLMTRLRAADPAATLDAPPPGTDAITAARRRRASRRATGGATAAVAAALAVAFAPLGGNGGAAPVLATAAEAAQLPPSSIVVTTSDVHVRSTEGGIHQRRTTWVRVGGSGQILEARIRNTVDGRVTSDEVSRGSGANAVFQSRDPRTGDVRTEQGRWTTPSTLLLDAQAVLRAAQRDGGEVTETTLDGRPAHRIAVTGTEDPARPGDRDELIVDADTFAPLLVRKHSEGTAVNGFTYDYTERVLEQRTLPDTAEHRAALRLR